MRRRSAGPREYNYKQLVTVGLLPFLLGLFLILALVRRPQSGASVPDRALLNQPVNSANCSQLPQPAPPCNCSQQGQQSQQLAALAQTLPQETVDTVLGAANSTDPAEQTVRVHAEPLPSLFLFVGILSGRGYRHRRLAVRESWANLASQSGDVTCRYIFHTPPLQSKPQSRFPSHLANSVAGFWAQQFSGCCMQDSWTQNLPYSWGTALSFVMRGRRAHTLVKVHDSGACAGSS